MLHCFLKYFLISILYSVKSIRCTAFTQVESASADSHEIRDLQITRSLISMNNSYVVRCFKQGFNIVIASKIFFEIQTTIWFQVGFKNLIEKCFILLVKCVIRRKIQHLFLFLLLVYIYPRTVKKKKNSKIVFYAGKNIILFLNCILRVKCESLRKLGLFSSVYNAFYVDIENFL